MAENIDFGSANRRKMGFFAAQIFRGAHMNTHIGYKIFQNIPRGSIAKIGPGTLKNLWWGKNNTVKI